MEKKVDKLKKGTWYKLIKLWALEKYQYDYLELDYTLDSTWHLISTSTIVNSLKK